MKLLPEACLRSWDRPLNFVDDPDYNPDSGSGLLSGSLGGDLLFSAVLGVIVHFFQKFFKKNCVYITIFFGYNRWNSLKEV